MTNQKPATRLYLSAALVVGRMVEIDVAQAHRLRNVLRLGPGDAVAAFNARDGEFLCRIAELGRNHGVLALDALRRAPEREADLWLLFAPLKRLRHEWLIEKATELGVAAFVPVLTDRTQPDRLNRERLMAHAIAAAEQSERLSIPELRDPASLACVLANWSADRYLLVCDETGGGAPIGEAVAALTPDTPAAVMVGPEGGFTNTELDALGNLPFVTRARLGPRVLRAETAALATLAVFQAIAGDGRRARALTDGPSAV
jgi:16S rRNA (uracil1498-N3)-methyltransferase